MPSSRQVREIKEVEGGYYDEEGFYCLPDGGKNFAKQIIILYQITNFPNTPIDFYDPDGYYFNKEGFDEFGGRYDNEGLYIPGEKNKHEFQDMYAQEVDDDEYNDELVRQFENGEGDDDDDQVDEEQERLYREFLRKEKHAAIHDDADDFED